MPQKTRFCDGQHALRIKQLIPKLLKKERQVEQYV